MDLYTKNTIIKSNYGILFHMTPLIDSKDLEILELLKSNSKLTVQQLSRKTSIPPTTIHNRIKQMEESKIIQGYSITIDKTRIGLPISVFILVTIHYDHTKAKKFSQKEVARQIKAIKGVEHVAIVTGKTDILVRADLEGIQALDSFLLERLRNIEGINQTETLLILSEF